MTNLDYNLETLQEYILNLTPKNDARKGKKTEPKLPQCKDFLTFCGWKETDYSVIHVAGTSGKTSTTYFLKAILESQGLKVGTHTSPYIIDFREKFQLNFESQFNENELVKFFIEKHQKYEERFRPGFSYLELSICFSLLYFSWAKVEIAVVEVGCGGLFDTTNVFTAASKISVINQIGYDHQELLGDTIEKIAFQKAGIINSNSQVVCLQNQEYPAALQVILETAGQKSATVTLVDSKSVFLKSEFTKQGVKGIFSKVTFGMGEIVIPSFAKYQLTNLALAIKAAEIYFSRKKVQVDNIKLQTQLLQTKIPGRFDLVKLATSSKSTDSEKWVLIDGAHNSQKMTVFIESLREFMQQNQISECDFLLSFKGDKKIDVMLTAVSSIARRITLTKFSYKMSEYFSQNWSTELEIKRLLENVNFKNLNFYTNPKTAFKKSLNRAPKLLVVTGSLYLAAEVYEILKNES